MKRSVRVRLRRIRKKRSYSTHELANLLGVHPRTVQTWRREGMQPIDDSDRFLLFMGFDVRRFLKNRRERHKCKLGEDEFYCPRCRRPRKSDSRLISVEITKRTIGKQDRQAIIRGICTECGCRLTRFGTKSGVENSIWRYAITQSESLLMGYVDNRVNTDIARGE